MAGPPHDLGLEVYKPGPGHFLLLSSVPLKTSCLTSCLLSIISTHHSYQREGEVSTGEG